jgi:hypothetical protein
MLGEIASDNTFEAAHEKRTKTPTTFFVTAMVP